MKQSIKELLIEGINIIKDTFESQLNKKVSSIHQYENMTNNRVFRIETKSQPYIFKIYNSGWPENGKLMFVSDKLDEYNIPHAKTLVFNRDDESFPNGYLIEKCLPGITADRLTLPTNDTLKLFKKLAALVLKIHRIKLTNYGYIGRGKAEWITFSEFMYDSLKDCTSNLINYNLIDDAQSLCWMADVARMTLWMVWVGLFKLFNWKTSVREHESNFTEIS